jgi:hypothetical protein
VGSWEKKTKVTVATFLNKVSSYKKYSIFQMTALTANQVLKKET